MAKNMLDKSDVSRPVGNVGAMPTQSGAKEMPEATTALKMGTTTKGNSIPPISGGKAGATGPGKKSGTI